MCLFKTTFRHTGDFSFSFLFIFFFAVVKVVGSVVSKDYTARKNFWCKGLMKKAILCSILG